MIVQVRLFAVMAQDAGSGSVALELSSGAGLPAVREELRKRFPRLRWPPGTLWAVNQEYVASEHHELRDGDEIAIIPPVSGG